MKSPLRNSRGVVEIALTSAFRVAVGIGIIAVIVFSRGYGLGVSTDWEEKFYLADAVAKVQALYAVREDINFVTAYPFPDHLGLKIKPQKVTVYTNKTKIGAKVTEKSATFTEDPERPFIYGEIKPKDTSITFFKEGKKLGVLRTGQSLPRMVTPVCSDRKHGKKNIKIKHEEFKNIGKDVIQIAERDASIYVGAYTGDATVRIYVNNEQESADLACSIATELFKSIPEMKGYAIIPINLDLLHPDDKRQFMAVSGLAAYVDISVPFIDVAKQSAIGLAVQNGVNNFAS